MLLPAFSMAQSAESIIEKIISRYENNIRYQSPALFLHLDKNIYVQNENIWFTAYLLNRNADSSHHTLYVFLVDQQQNKCISSDRFVINEGISRGNLFLPDTLRAGEYRLLAFTNMYLADSTQQYFDAPISLRSSRKPPFESVIKSITQTPRGDSFHVVYKITTDYGGLAAGGDIKYKIYSGSNLYRAAKQKIDVFGEFGITVPKQLAKNKLELIAEIAHNKDTNILSMPVLADPNLLTIGYYPEGGHLVDKQVTTIAIEVKDAMGNAVSVTGALLENNKPVNGFFTGVNGVGYITFIPAKGSQYKVALDSMHPSPVVDQFPEILSNGYTLRAARNIIKGDTCDLVVQAPVESSKLVISVHNYKQLFYTGMLIMKNRSGAVKLPTHEWPAGIVTIAIIDTSGVQQAERSVFVAPQHKAFVRIETDSATYHQRSKVQLRIKITDENNQPVRAAFSFSVAASRRTDTSRTIDIHNFEYIGQYERRNDEDDNLPLGSVDNVSNLNAVMMTRFRQTNAGSDNPGKDSLKARNPFQGYVLYNDKKLKAPEQLMLFGKNIFTGLKTDTGGTFTIPHWMVIDSFGNFITASVMPARKNQQSSFSLNIKDNGEEIGNRLAAVHHTYRSLKTDPFTAEEKRAMKSMLKEVVVKAKENPDSYFAGYRYIDQNCSATVCACDHWMCNGCKPIQKPVVGKRYLIKEENRYIIYMGCPQDALTEFMKRFKATYIAKDFYAADYALYPSTEPEILTTIYWNHLLFTDEKGEATVSFYTNDITGRFSCVLQGITNTGVVSGRQYFRVDAQQ